MPSRRASISALVIAVAGLAALAWWVGHAPRPRALTLRTSAFLVSAPILVADAYGDFADQGLAVRLQLHDTGRKALAALLAEGDGYATAADTPLMHAACARQRFAILATIGETRDGVQIIARREAGISAPTDLAGKRVATPPGTNGDFYLRSYLTMHGLDPAAVRILDLPPADAVESLVDGRSDAACLWDPHLRLARERLAGAAVALHEPALYQFSWNLVRGDGPGDAEVERRLLRALARAGQRIERDPAVRRWLGARLDIPEGEEERVLDAAYFRPHLNHGLVTGMEDQARVLLDDPEPAIDFAALIDPRALLAIDPNAVRLIR